VATSGLMTLRSVDVYGNDVKRGLPPTVKVLVVGRYLSAGMLRPPEGPGTTHRLDLPPYKRPVSGCYLIGGNSPRSQLFGAGSGALRVIRAC
jgi:hypothetical protein